MTCSIQLTWLDRFPPRPAISDPSNCHSAKANDGILSPMFFMISEYSVLSMLTCIVNGRSFHKMPSCKMQYTMVCRMLFSGNAKNKSCKRQVSSATIKAMVFLGNTRHRAIALHCIILCRYKLPLWPSSYEHRSSSKSNSQTAKRCNPTLDSLLPCLAEYSHHEIILPGKQTFTYR